MRIDGRALDELRSVKFTPDFTKFAEGSCRTYMLPPTEPSQVSI